MSVIRTLVIAVAMAFSPVLVAGVDPAVEQKIVAGLKQWRPDLNFTNIIQTPISGLYHVQVVGGPSIYTSVDGRYFIQGDLNKTSLGSIENWLDGVYAPRRRELIAAANPDDMVVFKPGGESRAVMYVFTDIDCGFCRKLHREVPALNDMGVEVRYLAFPRAGIGSESARKLESVWCADDPLQAMSQIKQGREIASRQCATTAIQEHMQLVENMGLNATPAIILADGTLVSGYRRAGQLKQILGL